MFRTIVNGVLGLASGSAAWLIGAMQHIEATFRFVGVVAGGLCACMSLAMMVRSWRRGQ